MKSSWSPTVCLLIAFALLLELATSRFCGGAGDNGSGVSAAIALRRALDAAPPKRMTVDLVLQGAGDGEGIGLRDYLRSTERTPETVSKEAIDQVVELGLLLVDRVDASLARRAPELITPA